VTGRPQKPETAWRYLLEPAADRTTRLTESFELVKPLGAISNFVTRVTTGVKDRRADLEENIGASLARIKEIAEA
jgi:phage host-nuclease inhibitor protein Gam